MAKRRDANSERILLSAAKWRDRCLLGNGSVFSDAPLWTIGNVTALHDAFWGNLIEDSERGFYDKLQEQVRASTASVKQLAAEFIWVILLFPSGIKGLKKRRDVRSIWAWSGADLPEAHPDLAEVLEHGIGNPGVAYSTLRWREFGYFLKVARALLEMDETRRKALLKDSWAFAEWLDSQESSDRRQFRHILLYLLFPDDFERISISKHKRAIAIQFGELIGAGLAKKDARGLPLLELDKRVLQIRRELEQEHAGVELDFYRPPLSDRLELKRKQNSGDDETDDEGEAPDDWSIQTAIRNLYSKKSIYEDALHLLDVVLQAAGKDTPGRWALTPSPARIVVNVGRVPVLVLRPRVIKLVVADEYRSLIPAGVEAKPSAHASGLTVLAIPPPMVASLLPELTEAMRRALGAAAASAKRTRGSKRHSPELVAVLEREVGHSFPGAVGQSSPSVPPPAVAVTTPVSGFRATELDLDTLVGDVASGDLALPDIQRPFVWSSTKVRDLFDSMYRGYPVGYLLFWETSAGQVGTRAIGVNDKPYKNPKRLIVDGQQRLTSLFAVMRGVDVIDETYRHKRIEISFRPRDGAFDVADAATRNDPEYIANVSDLFTDGRGSFGIINEFLSRLAIRRMLTPRENQIIASNLERLFQLRRYRFSVLEISAELDEEAVADIFVRINSEGKKLNQSDFILTLLSVIWEEGRMQLEAFARSAQIPSTKASPFNHLIAPSPDQMLRVAVGLAFNRARLKSVYHLLRGKDPDTGVFDQTRRDTNLDLLKAAHARALDLANWQRFIVCITASGFRLAEQVVSQNALLSAYVLYLRGLSLTGLAPRTLDRLIGRWFWMSLLTARYSTSPETTMEADFASLAVSGGEEFARAIEREIASRLTNDFWKITLPLELETSSTRSGGWATFAAAQLRLDAQTLFSDKKLVSMLDPLTRGTRKPVEVHHLFPKSWLKTSGVQERKKINQIANFAYLEWPENLRVGSRPPKGYLPEIRLDYSDGTWEEMGRMHALPQGWEEMSYPNFLEERRKLMARVIQRGFESLSDAAV